MSTLEIILFSTSTFFVLGTVASYVKWSNWWIRVFDFPRLQISAVLLLLLIASFVFYDFSPWRHYVLVVAIITSLILQGAKIYRYTPFAKKQVLKYKGDENDNSVSLIVSNVLQSNKNALKLIELAKRYKPDLMLTLESDKWWEEQLQPLEKEMPFTLKKPQDNLYGMHLYSRLKLHEPKINFLIKDDIPSFEALVNLPSGVDVKIYCLHPKPPFPDESTTSENRDGELLLVGKKLKNKKGAALIFGDLNDVAWSQSTTLFQKVSGMLDPRIGRGFFNTFHVKYPLMRWPLDHVFHSSHFKLIDIRKLPSIDSDHFPMHIKLQYQPEAQKKQDEPESDSGEEKRADEKIKDAETGK